MAIAGPASVFARKHRSQLFPDTPLLFAAVDQRYLRDAPLGENETAVAVDNRFPQVVDDILQVLPQTRQVFMVTGSGVFARFWRRELEDQFRRFHDRLTFVWFDDLSLPEILRRSASLPANSAIFYFTFGTDAAGAAYADERVLADLHATANAPLFAPHSVYLGTGVVGGSLMAIDDLSRRTADVATRLLNGAPPRSIRRTAAIARSTDLRLARAAAVGHPREPVAAGERRALSRSEPVERIPRHSAERRRCAGRPIAPDRRAPVPAPRTAAGRDRQPEEPGARR